jgi:hypothetical protein
MSRSSLIVFVLFFTSELIAQSQTDVSHLVVTDPSVTASRLRNPSDEVDIVVGLTGRPLAAAAGVNAKRIGIQMSAAAAGPRCESGSGTE